MSSTATATASAATTTTSTTCIFNNDTDAAPELSRLAIAPRLMAVKKLVAAGIARPFGDERTVQQAFPRAITEKESDPFLMCDYFNLESRGTVQHPDDFPVDWHPHRGMDILSYLRSGKGRHGDSLGNRETFETPGMQWMSVGSGVEHAEGGGTPAGEVQQGFQIWLNVPKKHKMDDPVYGTEPPSAIPQAAVPGCPGANARLLAGPMGGRVGAFRAKAEVQVVDFDVEAGARLVHEVPAGMDNAILYVYDGAAALSTGGAGESGGSSSSGSGGGETATVEVPHQSVVQFDLSSSSSGRRAFELTAGAAGPVSAILFAGKRLNEPIAWHGPIVMNTQAEIQKTFRELRTGAFPPVRVPWDYHTIANKPKI